MTRCRSSYTPGRNSTRATLFRELAGHGARRLLAAHAGHQVAAHLFPGNALAGFEELRPTPVGLGMEVGAAFGLLRLFGNGFEDEAVRTGAGRFRRPGDAGLERVRQADGGGAHAGLPTVGLQAM